MSEIHSTQQIVSFMKSRIYAEPDVRLETGLSLPVPDWSSEKTILRFFVHPIGGPIDNILVRPPFYYVNASIYDLDDVQFVRVHPHDLGINVEAGEVLCKLNDVDMTYEQYEVYLLSLYQATDGIIASKLQNDNHLFVEHTTAYLEIFHRLAIPELIPAYKALNPDLFDL